MVRTVMDVVSGRDFYRRDAWVLPCIAVNVKAWEIAGGNVQPQSVSSNEQVTGGEEPDSDWIHCARLHEFRLSQDDRNLTRRMPSVKFNA